MKDKNIFWLAVMIAVFGLVYFIEACYFCWKEEMAKMYLLLALSGFHFYFIYLLSIVDLANSTTPTEENN